MAASLSVARKPSLLTRIAYGIGGAASGVKNNGFEYFLLLYYSQVLGISASLVAGALFLALVVDAVSDPVVGYWSDNVRTRSCISLCFHWALLIFSHGIHQRAWIVTDCFYGSLS